MQIRRAFITGAAGFIGSNLADRLLQLGCKVVGYDNFSTGQLNFLADASNDPNFNVVKGDLLDFAALSKAMSGCDTVFHLAANADVRFGTQHPSKDLQQNTIATFNVLEAMRENGLKTIVFSSTGSVYGVAELFPTPEDCPFPVQTSLYGASKIACEGLLSAYCEGFDFSAYIFRFVSILGERYSHGHVFDFYRQLLSHPQQLDVLGDGTQKKSYLYVHDCIDAILLALAKKESRVNIFNLGTDDYIELNDSIKHICASLNLSPQISYSGGNQGWIGDNPFIFLDCSKIKALGWSAKFDIREGISRTLSYLQENPWLLEVQ